MIVEFAHRVPERSPPVKSTSTASAFAMFRTLSVSVFISSREYIGAFHAMWSASVLSSGWGCRSGTRFAEPTTALIAGRIPDSAFRIRTSNLGSTIGFMSTHAPVAPAEQPSHKAQAANAPRQTGCGLRRRTPRAGSRQRADQVLRARFARARGAEGAPHVDGGGEDRHPADHRRQGDPDRPHREVGDAARSPARARRVPHRGPGTRRSRRSRRRPPRAANGPAGRGKIAPRSSSAPPSFSPRPGARRSTRRRCSGSRRRCSRRRSTRRAR